MSGFRVGDRVKRQIDVFDPSSGYRAGTIVRRYGKHGGLDGLTWFDPEVYDVAFDDGKREGGFFRHGLEPAFASPLGEPERPQEPQP